jgi:xylulokinase
MTYLMGIDLGSTSLKAVVYDLAGRVAAHSSRPTEKHEQPGRPGSVVWLPEQIWGGVAEAIREAVAQLADPRAIRAVAVTGMGLDAVPLGEDGRWLYPFISWHDQRTLPQQQWWLEQVGNDRTFSAGGWPAWANNTALRMLWLAEHEPDIHTRTARWLLIEDFINYMLCGVQATDYSMASCTLLFDQRARTWSDGILTLAGISRNLLCDPRPSGTPLGEVTPQAAEATGLAAGTPVILGGHDHLCGALPVGAFRPGLALDVTGTWEIVMTVMPEPVLSAGLLASGVVVQSHVARGMFAAWGASVAGEMLEWYRREYGGDARRRAETDGGADWDHLMESASAAAPGAGGVLFLPHMSGASCPVIDARSRGAFVGLTGRTSASDMLRAVIEGLDYQFLHIVSTMEAEMGFTAERFIAVGGAVRNRFWMQNKADVAGRPVEAPDVEEATPLGAAILAGIGAGLYRDEQDAFEQIYRPGPVYEPDLGRAALYREAYALYSELYPALRTLNHRLHGRYNG